MPAHDVELWAFMEQVGGRNLVNLSEAALCERLAGIDKNILYLDSGSTPRDHLPADHGWHSPWWWLRARHWTLLEFERRGITPNPVAELPSMPTLADEFHGTFAGGRKLLARVSKKIWLLDLLGGRVRFALADSYRDLPFDPARADEELQKAHSRPGQAISILDQRGKAITAIGDVKFAKRRFVERGGGVLEDIPYWFCSFSSDLDPRLIQEFPESDACIVIFDPTKFVERALPHLNRATPRAVKSLFPNTYFDPYFLNGHKLSTLVSKDMSFAYQREMRFVLDPEGGPALADRDFFVEIGPIADIAAVYAPSGERISGTGPDNFLRKKDAS